MSTTTSMTSHALDAPKRCTTLHFKKCYSGSQLQVCVPNDKKCQFRQSSLSFLGHLVSAQGIEPDTEHVKAIAQAPPPHDAGTLCSFLGMLSWYNKFIPNYTTVVEPLRAILCSDSVFKWTDAADKCFRELKQLLVDSSALALYDPALPSIVSTDASDYGIGAVFTQIHPNNIEHTVAFASRGLTQAKRKYATVERGLTPDFHRGRKRCGTAAPRNGCELCPASISTGRVTAA